MAHSESFYMALRESLTHAINTGRRQAGRSGRRHSLVRVERAQDWGQADIILHLGVIHIKGTGLTAKRIDIAFAHHMFEGRTLLDLHLQLVGSSGYRMTHSVTVDLSGPNSIGQIGKFLDWMHVPFAAPDTGGLPRDSGTRGKGPQGGEALQCVEGQEDAGTGTPHAAISRSKCGRKAET